MNIITPRLIIRELQPEDAEDYHSIFGDADIARYDDYELSTLEEAERNISEYRENYDKNPIEIEYGVEFTEKAEVIGIINLTKEEDRIYIGFHFKKTFHGKGYAFEALEAVIKHLDIPLFAKVDPENERSIALLNKLGFQLIKSGKTTSGKKENIFTHLNPNP